MPYSEVENCRNRSPGRGREKTLEQEGEREWESESDEAPPVRPGAVYRKCNGNLHQTATRKPRETIQRSWILQVRRMEALPRHSRVWMDTLITRESPHCDWPKNYDDLIEQ
ncbi:hypothetical protein BHE74_00005977 [Ensete ventricosum]|nr:hypothetical protein BHE74_00005977 [Ensete ventricosum]